MLTKTNKFQISAAVLLLLTACGGGGGGSEAPKAVSPSPTAPTVPSNNNGGNSSNSGSTTTPTTPTTPATPETPSTPTTPATPNQPSNNGGTSNNGGSANSSDSANNSGSNSNNGSANGGNSNGTATDNTANNGGAINRNDLEHPKDPIHPGGVNGAVLAAMLDQHSDSVANDPKSIGYPVDNDKAPAVISTQSRDPGYTGSGNAVVGNYSPATGTYTYFTFNGGKATGRGGDASFDVNQITSSLDITNGENGVTLPARLTATEEGVFDYRQGTVFTGKAETIRYDEVVASGKHVFEWKNGASFVQLSVMVTGNDTAESCWTYRLPKTSRTYCNQWQVPANFVKGQALIHKGYTLVDSLDDKLDGPKNRWASR